MLVVIAVNELLGRRISIVVSDLWVEYIGQCLTFRFTSTVNAIIFLAPISSFDEWLVEDPNINRLVRSLLFSGHNLTHDPV